MKTVAVVLCGSGYRDGTEIREAVGVLWALSGEGVIARCFAPDADQADVIDCLTQKPTGESRNMRVEAARIARGQVEPLSELHVADYDALFIPGGFGVAKNLCTFATQGAQGAVRADLQKILEDFHSARKPIGAVCIAPALVGLAFRGKGIELSLGAEGETSQELEKMGHRHIVTRADQCHVDVRNKIVSSPAYMYGEAPLHEIFVGIQSLVRESLKLC